MKVVFLDFDGALVNRRSFYVRSGVEATADPPCVAALNRIVDKTGAVIVVSSTWRMGMSVIALRKLLRGWGVRATVIGKTPVFPSCARGSEIASWLANFPGCDFVILDDDDDMGRLGKRLVQTVFEDGLTEAHADMAIALLEPLTPVVHSSS